MSECNGTNLLEDKYLDFQMIRGSENENQK
jgi:hypothetical protein